MQELLQRQRRSPDGVISLTSLDFSSLVDVRNRPYNFVFLLTANYLMDKPQLQLRKLRKNFGIAAKAHKAKVEGTEDAGRSADYGQCDAQGWPSLLGCDQGQQDAPCRAAAPPAGLAHRQAVHGGQQPACTLPELTAWIAWPLTCFDAPRGC